MLRQTWARRSVRLVSGALAVLVALPPVWVLYYVYFDRSDLPDLAAFLRFEPPQIGRIYDARGEVLIELAHEYRQVVAFDDVPPVVRDAVLAAEDKNFFSHSGVDFTALPRVIRKTASSTLAAWWKGEGLRLRLPQGGSTLTQQLVRAYFLSERTRRQSSRTLFHDGLPQRLLSGTIGVPATNKLLRKLEEVRLALWLEKELRRRFGSKDRAKREIFARSASFHYVGNGRYGLAAGSEYYFGRSLSSFGTADAALAAALAGISKSPAEYSPTPGNLRCLHRRNQILELMARNGSLPASVARLCQARPLGVAERRPRKTEAPAAVGHVFEELYDLGGFRFGLEDLFQGRICVRSTVDERVQVIANEALENGIALYEKRHPRARGRIQGSVVALRNWDAAILAEVGGRRVYENRDFRYSDLNRATSSLRQPGSAWKPIVYLAAFRKGLTLESSVPDEPISVPDGSAGDLKWIANYDNTFKGLIPLRQALAESRNTVAVWVTRQIGLDQVILTARELGIRSPLAPYPTTALGASEVRLVELANAYRVMASAILATPHVIASVSDVTTGVLYTAPPPKREIRSPELTMIQEGLRGVVRMPDGTAHSLNGRDFPVPVMGKTGTTSDFRDALFVGSTYGPNGITVAVRLGFDDNRAMGAKETGGRAAMPIFREIMLRVYADDLLGPAPRFPTGIEKGIDDYLTAQARDLLQPDPEDVPFIRPQEAIAASDLASLRSPRTQAAMRGAALQFHHQ